MLTYYLCAVADFKRDPLGTDVTDEEFAVFEVEEGSKEYVVNFGEKDMEGEGGYYFLDYFT